jgi:hypothetical protein
MKLGTTQIERLNGVNSHEKEYAVLKDQKDNDESGSGQNNNEDC